MVVSFAILSCIDTSGIVADAISGSHRTLRNDTFQRTIHTAASIQDVAFVNIIWHLVRTLSPAS
ncbi:hypothetical protein WM40_08800 [Robbsia andropogonis]|uniref:Uncharacterized protein n=1 Tax=Robbsia andropogonis TaxID=28092 RepID=A0A0F5K115_9BURK|nr:hypothetical protein WM40_08800 [Robbsia andropogonis]